MTTFQDPPPQSRRAARESERAGNPVSGVYVPFSEPQQSQPQAPEPEAAQPEAPVSRPTGRRARSSSPSGHVEVGGAEPLIYTTQTRSQIPSYDGPSFARAQRAEAQNSAAASAPAAAPAAEPKDDAVSPEPQFRIHDYGPDSRRVSMPQTEAIPVALDYQTVAGPGIEHPAEAQVPAADTEWAPPVDEPTVEDTPEAIVEAQAPAAPTPAVSASAEDRPLTRRELRAMREAAEAASGTAPAPLVEPEVPAATSTALSNAMAEFEALTRTNQPVLNEDARQPEADHIPIDVAPDETAVSYQPVSAASASAEPVTVEPTVAEAQVDEEPLPELVVESEPAVDALVDLPIVIAETESDEPAPWPFAGLQPSTTVQPEPIVDEGPAEPEFIEPEIVGTELFESVETEPVEAEVESSPVSARTGSAASAEETAAWSPSAWSVPVPTTEAAAPGALIPDFVEPNVRETYTPPVGHWSRQADLDDENQPHENTLSRQVGGSNVSTTTSALILPSIPQGDFANLIQGTGEILVTGSIGLPPSLATMGGDARRYDDPGVDHMFDAFDGEVVSNDSAPVRAIRAVSTHTSSRGVIQTAKPKGGNRLLTAGIVTVIVVAVGLVGVLSVYIISSLTQ